MGEDILELQSGAGSVGVLQNKFESMSRWQTAIEEDQAANRETRQTVQNILAAFTVVGASSGIFLTYYLFVSFGKPLIAIFALCAYVGAFLTLRGYRLPFLN